MIACNNEIVKVNIEHCKAIEHYELGQTMLINRCQETHLLKYFSKCRFSQSSMLKANDDIVFLSQTSCFYIIKASNR
ncbi:hypothetical protein DERP_002096 [Dermatophagoides pteronyssinus]|uniref:Uncharacterized protein n=1 Tax=Dermatophagoides pteronyssinus TaxID=6956 RepID=A0ABQ8JGT0_DERPT|nr:hypothetical protein DERP_002096 [Dermatophagoides pteronyssinus]